SFKDFNQISESNLKATKESFRRWENRVTTYLTSSFSDNSIAEKFSNSSGVVLMMSAPFQKRCDKLIDDIEERITRLKMIVEAEDINEESGFVERRIPIQNQLKSDTERWYEIWWVKFLLVIESGLITAYLVFQL